VICNKRVYIYSGKEIHKVLKAINVTKEFHGNVVISNVNLEVRDNDKVAIIGLHNSGKTVLMEILSGEIKPTQGKVLLDGKKVNNRKIAYAPQIPKFIPTMKVKEVMKYVTDNYDPFLDELGLDKEKRIRDLSLDEKKRLSIALSLPFSPKHLLFDDLSSISNITKEFIRKFNGTIILAHHNLKEVWDLIDKVVIISRGRITFNENKEELLYKIVKYVDEEGEHEIWEKTKEDYAEKILKERGVKFDVLGVTPDEVFLYFYARA
jgi:ABC-type multidrug transport system ATPase subunit